MRYFLFFVFVFSFLTLGCTPSEKHKEQVVEKISEAQAQQVIEKLLQAVDDRQWDQVIELHNKKIVFNPSWNEQTDKDVQDKQSLKAGYKLAEEQEVVAKEVFQVLKESFRYFDSTEYKASDFSFKPFVHGLEVTAKLEITEVAKGKTRKIPGKIKAHIENSGKIKEIRIARYFAKTDQSKAVTQEK